MLNSVVLMGRLTADPEARTTASNLSVTTFTLAVERNYANKQNGERTTDFIDIVAWRSTADFVVRYFKKGQLVAVQGSLQVRSYEDKDGNRRKAVEITVRSIHFSDSKKDGQSAGQQGQSDDFACPDGFTEVPLNDDDLPF